MDLTLEDLAIAYRKAKVDLYYSNDPRRLELLEFEDSLEFNLQHLLAKLHGNSMDWIDDPSFLGTWGVLPKSLKIDHRDAPFTHSDPYSEWAAVVDNEGLRSPTAEFRLMSRCSIEMHVFSALWIWKVGSKLDAALPNSAIGNRLRRTHTGEPNMFASGSFQPYLTPFRRWRDNALGEMSNALARGESVVAITADVTAFFHNLDAEFLGSPVFVRDTLGVALDDTEEKLHFLFVRALVAWRAHVSELLGARVGGLPVGLPASGLVANLALIELDRVIEQQVKPLHYGRYVDDIMLVLPAGPNLRSEEEVWEWIFDRSLGLLSWDEKYTESRRVVFSSPNLAESSVVFDNRKNRVLQISGPTGQVLVDSIARTIHDRASEWRALPDLPLDAHDVATDVVTATEAGGDAADSLRKADVLSARRAGFAIKIRDLEAYERDLEPGSWAEHRRAFVDAVCNHIIVPQRYFELSAYLPRVVRLLVACGDHESLVRVMGSIAKLFDEVSAHCVLTLTAVNDQAAIAPMILSRWAGQLHWMLEESIAAAIPNPMSVSQIAELRSSISTVGGHAQSHWLKSRELERKHARLFTRDLGHLPFRLALLPEELVGTRGIPDFRKTPTDGAIASLLPELVSDGLEALAELFQVPGSQRHDWPPGSLEKAPGLAFATRPLGVSEIYIATRPLDVNTLTASIRKLLIERALLMLRGFSAGDRLPVVVDDTERPGGTKIVVGNGSASRSIRVALGVFETTQTSWTSSVVGTPDLTVGRYHALIHMLNELLKRPDGVDYLLLPELSIPARWFVRIAQKLRGVGINLIAGVEYLHASGDEVRNQTWLSLRHDGLGFPVSVVVRQDKQKPAYDEELNLHDVARKVLVPHVSFSQPPVVAHGALRFATLICSELTNITYRASLRGAIDALFVPEWNRDLNTFEALVESAALDIHAYIAQSNNRVYGDSRVRAPRSDVWLRDVVRVTGGVRDYVVIADLDIHELRAHQSAHRVRHGSFKPVPDGFKLSADRRVLPN